VNDYSQEDVAKLLGLSLAEIRRCVRDGVVSPTQGPDGKPRLSFQDLVVLRKAASFVSQRVPPLRVRQALKSARAQLAGRPLSGLSLTASGRSILVRDGEAVWDPLSRQMLLDFDEPPTSPPPAPARVVAPQRVDEANRLYEEACDTESAETQRAQELYRRALELVPEHVEARINLGRLLHAMGKLEAAEREYQNALAQVKHHPIAAFNLAVLLEDMSRPEEAVRFYQLALAVDPGCEDAHFNLARLLERLGDRTGALRHLQAYRKLKRP
jgi:tetratricopeptide (TPR) repeat protein